MNEELVLYDGMRVAIAKCAEVDEAAGIKNKAAQLEAYARVRDDVESQRKFAEIRLRACIRIGELSRELETAQGVRTELSADDRTKSKEATLTAAGIAKRTAYDYEQLAGGKEKSAQGAASAAADSYFTEAQTNNEPVTMRGLKGAVHQAMKESTTKTKRRKKKTARLAKLLMVDSEAGDEEKRIRRRFASFWGGLINDPRFSWQLDNCALVIIKYLTEYQNRQTN